MFEAAFDGRKLSKCAALKYIGMPTRMLVLRSPPLFDIQEYRHIRHARIVRRPLLEKPMMRR